MQATEGRWLSERPKRGIKLNQVSLVYSLTRHRMRLYSGLGLGLGFTGLAMQLWWTNTNPYQNPFTQL